MANRPHRVVVPVLLVLATLIGFAGAFAVWVNRQALNTDNWVTTSNKLLADQKVQTALGGYLVDQLYTNVNVAEQLKAKLPPQAQPLAAPVAAGLREVANRAAPTLLSRPRVQVAWAQANRAAHKQLLAVLNGGGDRVQTSGGTVELNLGALVNQLETRVGVNAQLPPGTGRLVIMRSNQLKTAQDLSQGVKHLAIVLPTIALIMFASAIALARGRRRLTLRTVGWCLVGIGLLLLLTRRVGGNQVVNGLVKVPSNKPAVHDVWNTATSLLLALAAAMIVYGLVVVASAWLAGPTALATSLRRRLAPTLRESPAMAYGAVEGLLLLIVVWGPTPAFRKVVPILIFALLLALGVRALRHQTALEFRGGPDTLERLVALHDRGELTDREFAAAAGPLR